MEVGSAERIKDKPLHILLIEDNPGDARLIREMLVEAGGDRFRLTHRDYLSAGLLCLAEGDADAVLLDLALPDSQELDTFRRTQAQAPRVPIVVLTGHDDESLAVEAVQAGAQDYLVKNDVSGPLLTRALRYAVERKRIEARLRSRERFLALLNDVTQAALATPDVPAMLQMLADRLGEVIDADGCYLTLWDGAARVPVPAAAYGPLRDVYPSLHVEPGEPTVTDHVLNTGHPAVIEDVLAAPVVSQRIAEKFPARSLLGLPLLSQEQKLGAVLLAFDEPHHFTPGEIARGEQAARHVALALAQARLVEDLEAEVAARTAEIRAEKEKSETILRSVGDAIALLDLDMQVQYVNAAFTTLTGYRPQEILGRPAGHLLAGPPLEKDRRSLERAMQQEQVWRGELTIRRRDGRPYEAALTLAPVWDGEGQLVGYVSSHRDVSLEKDLARARTRFITNVSHQLRTPCTNLKLYARMLREGRRPEQQAHFFRVIDEQADRLCELVDDILHVLELDSGGAAVEWKTFSPALLFDIVSERFRNQASAADVNLRIAPPPPNLPLIHGDWDRLSLALNEIVENAVIFTPPGGTVTVEASPAQSDGHDRVAVIVRDTGPGIPPEEQAQIFDRFYRGTIADSGQIAGTGLGLSIVQEVVRAHGGRVEIESELGEGTTVRLLLPADSAASAEDLSSTKE